jgi:3-carboxy-cis,cis-muconate cycloisomerase
VLADVLAEHPDINGQVDPAALRKACDPALYLGSSAAQVVRVEKWLESE